ncbi:MOB kinase activator 3A-like [Rhopilema esculentum]|uniref:MOB kinase activator 3A-like n=1 Tax=Rhopilema esculentum TaxID=499914 RepID=UPI0031CF8342
MASKVNFKMPNKVKTFKPKKKWSEGTMKYDLHKRARATLRAGIDLKEAVKLPTGENLNDWLAVHVVDFFNRINLIYGTIYDYCTDQSCPVMSGGPKYDYYWADGDKYKKPTSVTARQYVQLLMDWTDGIINDEEIFPHDTTVPFPKNFQPIVKKIFTRLFRVFVHVYIHHFDTVVRLEAEPHVNQCYKHFYYFTSEFGLIEKRELEPLKEMTARIAT